MGTRTVLVPGLVLLVTTMCGCAKQQTATAPVPDSRAAQTPLTTGSGVTTKPATDAKGLFETKCIKCHKLEVATSRTETRERWEQIVKDMQGKQPGWISDAEAAQIADYLASAHGSK